MRIIIVGLICFLFEFGTVKAQYFTPIHNAQAPDYISVVKYFGIPYGSSPALNSTRVIPGALFYNTTDSAMYSWTGTQWIKAGNSQIIIDSSITIYNNRSCAPRSISGTVTIDSAFVAVNTDISFELGCKVYYVSASTFPIPPSSGADFYISIYVDTLGNIGFLQGGMSPPDIPNITDDGSQMLLKTYLIPAGSSTPQGVSTAWIYREGDDAYAIDSTGTVSPVIDSVYAINRYAGLHSLRVPSMTSGQYFEEQLYTTYNSTDFQLFTARLRLAATFVKNIRWAISLYKGNSAATSNSIIIGDGVNGYSRTVSGAYQFISADMSALNFIQTTFDRVRITFIGNSPSAHQWDDVNFKTDVPPANTATGVITFNGRDGHVIPLRTDYTTFYDSTTLNVDSTYDYHWNNGVIKDSIWKGVKGFGADTCFTIVDTIIGGKPFVWQYSNPYCSGSGGNDSAYLNATVYGNEIHLYRGNGDSTVITVSGGGSTNSNVGAGYRVAVSGTNNIKTLVDGFGILTDSTSNANALTRNIDTASAIGSKAYIDALAALKKDKADSIISTGYATQYDLTKTKDSLQTNIDLKKNSIDSVAGVATDYVTQYQRKKTSDSLLAIIVTKLSPADSVFLHGKLVSSFVKNAGGDSAILTLYDGTRFAVIDNNSGGGGGLASTNFVVDETPSGSINGSNTAFTLANTPVAGKVEIYRNGLLQKPGIGNDYTISGTAITYLTAPETGDTLTANYIK
ncbi:MAG: hypothetical protein V4560_14815 [Bacteroidota bacterium]